MVTENKLQEYNKMLFWFPFHEEEKISFAKNVFTWILLGILQALQI